MIYGLQIFCVPQRETLAAMHKPITVETLSESYKDISENEMQMVIEAFKMQVDQLVRCMADKKEVSLTSSPSSETIYHKYENDQ